MNEQYVFNMTPGIARKLVRISEISNTKINDSIREFAKKNDFDISKIPATVEFNETLLNSSQKLIDNNFRAIIAANQENDILYAILGALVQIDKAPIVIVTTPTNFRNWTKLAKRFGFSVGIEATENTDVLLVEPDNFGCNDVINNRRHGFLIIDALGTDILYNDNYIAMFSGITKEFPRTVITLRIISEGQNIDNLQTLNCYLNILFYTNPSALILPEGISDFSTATKYLHKRGFTRTKPTDLFFLFNIIDDLCDTNAFVKFGKTHFPQ